MASINISIKDEAYRFLKSLKQGEKSFSDFILEFKRDNQYQKGSKELVLQYVGVLKHKGIDWEVRKKRMR